MRVAAFLVALGIAVGGDVSAQSAFSWERRNIGGGGWFERIAAGPTGLLIACSDLGGAYRSHDRGATWQVLGRNSGLLTTHVASVAFHRQALDLAYLGTEDGVYRSLDCGETWTRQSSSGYVEHVAIAPTDANVAYAGWHPAWNSPNGQVWRTADRGANWTRVDQNLPTGHRILELIVADDDANTVYLRSGVGRFASGPVALFRSTNGGAAWTSLGGGFGGRLVDVATDPFAPAVLWASVDDANPAAAGHLHRSNDRGSNWTAIAQRGGALWLDRTVPGTVRMLDTRYAYPWDAREGSWESTAFGAPGSWTRVSSVTNWARGWSSAHWVHTADLHCIGGDARTSDAIYWVNGQFAFASFDRGRTVQQLHTRSLGGGRFQSTGFDNVVMTDLAVSPSQPEALFAAFLDLGTWRSLDRGRSWTPCNLSAVVGAWNGAGGNTWSLLVDPANGVVWAPQGESATSPSTLLRSADAGTTWTIVGGGLPAAPILGLSLDAASPAANRRLFATANGDVHGSNDGGASWTPRLIQGGMRVTAVDPTQPNIVYAGGEGGLWRSTASGVAGSFVEVGTPAMRGTTPGLPFRGWSGVHDVVPDASSSGRVYACVTGTARGLYRSTNSGASWPAQPLLVDDHLRSLAIAPGGAELWATSSSAVQSGGYQVSSRGVLHSLDGGQSWQSANADLPWPFANAIVLAPDDPSRVYVGSPGAGIHERVRRSLAGNVSVLRDGIGAQATFQLDAGSGGAGNIYLLVASLAGTHPGIPLGPQLTLPLNFDVVLQASIDLANSSMFANSLGVLDGSGRATAAFAAPPGLFGAFLGRPLAFAWTTLPFGFVGGPLALTFVP
jgi:hypothetical protein